MSEPTLREMIEGLIEAEIRYQSATGTPDHDRALAEIRSVTDAVLAAVDALEARLRETIAERDVLRARVAELEAPIKYSTGCCCTCTDPCHSRRDYGERCLRCGKHRPPRGRIVWDDEYDAVGGGK